MPGGLSAPAWDAIVLGAGGAGMMCAIQAGKRGRSVVVIDHSTKIGGKILISGGGRCNFTNLGASPAQYVSRNPHFARSALSRYPSAEFIRLVEAHAIPFHEKKLGQLFCDGSAQAIVSMMTAECEAAGVRFELGAAIRGVERLEGESGEAGGAGVPGDAASAARFEVVTERGTFRARSLVVATGGLSIPKLGATGLGYDLARRFGLAVTETAPALDGFTFGPAEQAAWGGLAGLSVDCEIRCISPRGERAESPRFRENILFTHAGLSGPAALQASLHWYPGDAVSIDLLPGQDLFEHFVARKREGSRALVRTLFAERLPSRLADRLADAYFPELQISETLPLPQVSEKALRALDARVHAWRLLPSGTVGYGKAEVTRGGVDTDALSSKTMEAKRVPGLYFIGEVVDVTGWLGGYNFQWAWASGWAAGQAV